MSTHQISWPSYILSNQVMTSAMTHCLYFQVVFFVIIIYILYHCNIAITVRIQLNSYIMAVCRSLLIIIIIY